MTTRSSLTEGDLAWVRFMAKREGEREDTQEQSPPSLQVTPPVSVLTEAESVVTGRSRDNYGTPRTNHERTAAMWSAYLGFAITARQVCMLNALQKISRDAFSAKRDNLVDIAGYVRNVELLDDS